MTLDDLGSPLNTQDHLTSPMSEGGEPKQNTQDHLTSPMSEGGELREENLNRIPKII